MAGPSRSDIDEDSTAVLAFDDGTRIPCDRFLMRSFSQVIRRLLEDSVCDLDSRGRTVVPIPDQPPLSYWAAVDVLHGAALAWRLPLDDVMAVTRCMEFLAVTVHDAALDARLWYLIKDEEAGVIVPHAPRLLRNPGLAAVVMRRLIQLRPLWHEFHEDVLDRLKPHADTVLVNAVVAYAPNFFPPHLVVLWALDNCPHVTQETALRLASQHGVMYHPTDSPAVLRRLIQMADAGHWDGALTGLLRTVVASVETYDVVPLQARRAHGSVVKFHDSPTASVCLTLERGRLPRAVALAQWLKLTFFQDGRFGVSFKPRKIDDSSRRCTKLQLRITCFEKKRSAECWYLYDDIDPAIHGGDTYLLAHASGTLGDVEALPRMLAHRVAALQMRMDFFFGQYSILDNPFDPNSATKATANFLSSNLNIG